MAKWTVQIPERRIQRQHYLEVLIDRLIKRPAITRPDKKVGSFSGFILRRNREASGTKI